jgi:hypothetical protein
MELRKICVLVAVLLVFFSLHFPWWHIKFTAIDPYYSGSVEFSLYIWGALGITGSTGTIQTFVQTFVPPSEYLFIYTFIFLVLNVTGIIFGTIAIFKRRVAFLSASATLLSTSLFYYGLNYLLIRLAAPFPIQGQITVQIPLIITVTTYLGLGFWFTVIATILFFISPFIKKKDLEKPPPAPTPTPTPALPVATKFCIHCGAEISSTATFCSKCGKKQE